MSPNEIASPDSEPAGRAGYSSAAEVEDAGLRGRARDAAGDIERFITANPLVAGLAAAAIGAIAGALIPETKRENELFGSRRDDLLDRGRTLAREGLGRAKSTVKQKARALLDEGQASSPTVASASDWGNTETP